ncbi:MAG: DNA polymerase [Ktedonobacteraceae bacterium]
MTTTMRTPPLLEQLQASGIQVVLQNGRVHVVAPQGVLTAEMRQQLHVHRDDLLAWLTATPAVPEQLTPAPAQPSPRLYVSSLARLSNRETFLQDVAALSQELLTLPSPRFAALDLETTGLDARKQRVVSLALGVPGRVSILDLRPYYGLASEQQTAWRVALQELLHRDFERVLTWVGQNLKFDWHFLAHHFGVQLNPVYDIMLVEQVLFGQDPGQGSQRHSFSLREIAGRYQRTLSAEASAKLAVSKEERSWFVDLDQRPDAWAAPFPEEQVRYMCQDIEVPYRIMRLQQPMLLRQNLVDVAHLENNCLPAIAAMEVQGVLVDRAGWQHALQQKHARRAELETALVATLGQALQAVYQAQHTAYRSYQRELLLEEKRLMHLYATSDGLRRTHTWEVYRAQEIGRWQRQHVPPHKPSNAAQTPINLGSSAQVIAALAQLDIVVPSIREEVLEEHARQQQLIAQLLEWRKLQHFCNSFGENILAYIQDDGRIHAHFAQIGAVSGRIICRNPNLQQMPKKREEEAEDEDIRRCFVAPMGHMLLKVDLSNIELRILAEVAQDETMLRFFAEGRDLHAETAKLMFHLPPETNTKEHLYNGVVVREIAKTINYGLAYGMGVQGLASRVNVPDDEARDLMHAYFRTYPSVNRWLRQAATTARKQGYSASLAGRKRFLSFEGLDEAQSAALSRIARNHPIQATNADILKYALTILYDVLPSINAQTILAVHDEIVLECPIAHVEEATALLKEGLLWACRAYLKVVSIPEPEVLVAGYWKKG